MYMYPMGEETNPPVTPYKSAEVSAIDVDSEDYEEEVISTDNDLYKRITKRWMLAQELAGLTIYTSSISLLFLVLRSIDWFVVVLALFGLVLVGLGLMFSFAWTQFKTLDRFRLFAVGIGTGFAAAVSGWDIALDWFYKNEQLTKALLGGFVSLAVIATIGFVGLGLNSAFKINAFLKKRGY